MDSEAIRNQKAGYGEHLRNIARMYRFLTPVPFQNILTILALLGFIFAEVKSVDMAGPAVDIIKNLANAPAEHRPASIWEWLTNPTGTGADLRHALMWLAGFKLLLGIMSWAKTVSATWQSMSMVFYMREAVYDRLQRAGFALMDQYSTGQLINRAFSDLQAVRHFVLTGLSSGIEIGLSVFGYFILLYSKSPRLAFLMLAPLPVWYLAIRRFAKLSRPLYKKQAKANDEVVRVMTENIAGVHVVRAFATENLERERFREKSGISLARLLEGAILQARMTPVIRGIANACQITLFCTGAYFVQHGSLSLGDLVVFGLAMSQILSKVQQLNAIADAYQRAYVSSHRLFEILDCPDTTPEMPDAMPLRPGGGAVKFNHVTYGYEPGRPVLHDITFDVAPGSVVALVGPTGSGKTTLSVLLARFYDPDIGRIEIDGQEIKMASLGSVRGAVSYVFQETYLFSDTVARNIAYGDPSASMVSIKEAAHIARADEFIEKLTDKYETVIGEYGASLSGGQKQRLAIARAVLSNPRILVLDDALAAVDPETEELVRERLEKIMEGRTVFIITSRISTARNADKIIVLEKGRIVQTGTHDELMRQPGYYQNVASCQFTDEDSDEGQEESHMDRIERETASGGGRGRRARV